MKKSSLILSIFLLSISSFSFAHGPDEGYSWGPWMMWGHGGGRFWPIFMIIIPVAIIVGIIFLIRWLVVSTDQGRQRWKDESAMDILKRRYASGEISRDDYERMKKDLED